MDAVTTAAPGRRHASPATSSRSSRYAALLHDFGKVAVQEKYLRKEKKLYAGQMIAIRQRFAYILKSHRGRPPPDAARALRVRAGHGGRRSRRSTREYQRQRAEVERVLRRRGASANEPTVLEEESFRAFMDLPTRQLREQDEEDFPVEDWAEPPFLSADEVEALSIREGQPNRGRAARRSTSHVHTTYEFLEDPLDRRVPSASRRSPGPITRSSTAPATHDGSRPRTSPCSRG